MTLQPLRKSHLTSVQTALLALILSILSSGFGVYQWWSTGRDEKIRAAIDLSDKYITQRIDQKEARSELNQFQTGFGGSSFLNKIHNQTARLEYIAFLANRNLVNYDYLSQFILCDFLYPLEQSPEVAAFKKTHTIACSIQSINDSDDDSDQSEDAKSVPPSEDKSSQAPPETPPK
jgi:hypothetical protein